ncbi:glutamate ABC transporter substrate-binding protein [Rugosimonospora acidiphila]|uniref:Glutamate ABC transporter substrate-binding protein n=1 Tax=Rugosimonospora acidiphila TaxID=556531 RepID=A0ABP9SEW2_9ACTN
MRNRRALAGFATVLALVLGVGVLGGCAGPEPTLDDPLAALPAGAVFASAGPTAAEDTSCDPRRSLPAIASYRPQSGFLTIGVDQADATMSHWDPVTQTFAGFNIDLVKQIAQSIWPDGHPLDHLHFVVVPPGAGGFDALLRHEVDIVATSLTATCSRGKRVAFSDDTLDSGQSILVRKDASGAPRFDSLAALRGQRVCAAADTTSIDNLFNFGGLRVVRVDNVIDCLVMLEQDQVAAVSTDHNILLGFQGMTDDTIVPDTPSNDRAACSHHDATPCPWVSDEPHAFALRPDDTQLLGFINHVLESPAGRTAWTASHDRWLPEHHDDGDPQPPPPYQSTTWPFP